MERLDFLTEVSESLVRAYVDANGDAACAPVMDAAEAAAPDGAVADKKPEPPVAATRANDEQ